jgi:succinate--hydroxymethylglutarate CoA-transferase
LARKVVSEVEHPRAGMIKLLSPAINYNGKKMEVGSRRALSVCRRTRLKDDSQIRKPPPVLGQHTVEILRELGYTDEEMRRLHGSSVI